MRPPTMTGDDQPLPGISCFHVTFFVVSHSTGNLPDGTTPCPVGPRNSGQSSPRAAAQRRAATTTARAGRRRGMRGPLVPRVGQAGRGTSAVGQVGDLPHGRGYSRERRVNRASGRATLKVYRPFEGRQAA